MRTISNTPNTRCPQIHLVGTLHITFECDEAFNAQVGTPVKLDSMGKAVVANATDKPVGIVHVTKNNYHNGKPCVGVLTEFKAEVVGVANAAITAGQSLSVQSIAPNGATKYQVAQSGHYVSAIALESAAANDDVHVGVLSVSYKM